MTHATSRPGIDHRRTATLVADAIVELEDVIYGIDGLRALGEPAEAALAAVLEVPPVRKLSLSWQLVEALADGDGVDLEAHLIELLGFEQATYVRGVLFPVEPSAQLVLFPGYVPDGG